MGLLFPIHSRQEDSRISNINARMRAEMLSMRKKPTVPVSTVSTASTPVVSKTTATDSPINKILKAIVAKQT